MTKQQIDQITKEIKQTSKLLDTVAAETTCIKGDLVNGQYCVGLILTEQSNKLANEATRLNSLISRIEVVARESK